MSTEFKPEFHGSQESTSDTYRVPITEQETDKDKPKSRKGLVAAVAGTVATAAVAGGLWLGLSGDKESNEPINDRPVATAPANPTETQAPTTEPSATETTPSTSETGTSTAPTFETNGIDVNTFEFMVDGQTYTGYEAFANAQEISVEKYPEPLQAAGAVFDRVNLWINPSTPEYETKYNNYATADGEYAGDGAMMRDVLTPAWKSVLFAEGDVNAGAEPTEFAINQSDLSLQNAAYWSLTESEQTPFHAEYKIENSSIMNQAGDTAEVSVLTTYTDNGDQNSIGDRRQEAGGYQGIDTPKFTQQNRWVLALQKVDGAWKVIGVRGD